LCAAGVLEGDAVRTQQTAWDCCRRSPCTRLMAGIGDAGQRRCAHTRHSKSRARRQISYTKVQTLPHRRLTTGDVAALCAPTTAPAATATKWLGNRPFREIFGCDNCDYHWQSQLSRHLAPVRPDVSTDRSALRAHHAWTERWHAEIAREMIDIHDHLVPALVALERERRTDAEADRKGPSSGQIGSPLLMTQPTIVLDAVE
jgi:hypothetical protein